MQIDIRGALAYIQRFPNALMPFEHKGVRLSNEEIRKILEYGLFKEYETTADFSDEEIDEVLNQSE